MPAFHYDDPSHTYTLDGKRLPSVTQVLDPLCDWSNIPQATLEAKAELGRQVHFATDLYDQNDLDEDWLSANLPQCVPYVNAWKSFRQENGVEVEMAEAKLYHKRLGYAGTLDRVLKFQGSRWLGDIKCTAQIYDVAGIQTAAYNNMLDVPADRRCVIQLKPDGSYKLREFKAADDFAIFLSLLNIHNWKANHVH